MNTIRTETRHLDSSEKTDVVLAVACRCVAARAPYSLPVRRSPSPEPIYSTDGKRLNTREYRTRRKLEEQRHSLVQRMQTINPEFKPPPDYKPPVVRVHDKVMIPQEEHPDINFVGLLIGPRGNTLKAMEKETGAKIIIRGKGSVKEGKVGRKDGQPLPGEDEPLHAYITATNADAVKKAVDKIKEVIRQGVEVPEGQNDLRRMQLRELAQLNGTLHVSGVDNYCHINKLELNPCKCSIVTFNDKMGPPGMGGPHGMPPNMGPPPNMPPPHGHMQPPPGNSPYFVTYPHLYAFIVQ
ncbi:Splicing factor 1 [Operophtera brumata]|uniref:Branchpoint-bridging protein n=1 Tax=Operophtera brumata TaxID=104452 RepID=A0A0L7LKA5_OPEBR|nr:Splicing factor 1 [Operophtera brumata]